jgi:hypothetical protein
LAWKLLKYGIRKKMHILKGGAIRGIVSILKGNGRSDFFHSWDLGLLLPLKKMR